MSLEMSVHCPLAHQHGVVGARGHELHVGGAGALLPPKISPGAAPAEEGDDPARGPPLPAARGPRLPVPAPKPGYSPGPQAGQTLPE